MTEHLEIPMIIEISTRIKSNLKIDSIVLNY